MDDKDLLKYYDSVKVNSKYNTYEEWFNSVKGSDISKEQIYNDLGIETPYDDWNSNTFGEVKKKSGSGDSTLILEDSESDSGETEYIPQSVRGVNGITPQSIEEPKGYRPVVTDFDEGEFLNIEGLSPYLTQSSIDESILTLDETIRSSRGLFPHKQGEIANFPGVEDFDYYDTESVMNMVYREEDGGEGLSGAKIGPKRNRAKKFQSNWNLTTPEGIDEFTKSITNYLSTFQPDEDIDSLAPWEGDIFMDNALDANISGKKRKRRQTIGTQLKYTEAGKIISDLAQADMNEGYISRGSDNEVKLFDWKEIIHDEVVTASGQGSVQTDKYKWVKEYTDEGKRMIEKLEGLLIELDEDHGTADLTNFHYRKALYQNTGKGWENSNDFTTAILLDDEINSGIGLYNNGVPYTFMDVGTKQDIFGMGSGNNQHLGIYRPSTTLSILTKNSNLPGGYLGGFDKNAILGYKDILAATRANDNFGIKPKLHKEFSQPGRDYTNEEVKTFVANIYDENESYVREFFDNDEEFREWFDLIDKERGILNEIDKLQGEFKELPKDSDKRVSITTKLASLNAQLDLLAVSFDKVRSKESHLRFTALYDYNGNRHDKEVVENLQGSNNIADNIWASNTINFNKLVNDNIKNFNDVLMTGQIDAAGILDVGHNLVFRDMMWTEMLDNEDGYRIQLTPGVWRSKIEGFSRQAFGYYLDLKENNPERLSQHIKNGRFKYQGKEYDLSMFDKVEEMDGEFNIPERQFNIKDDEVWLSSMSLSDAFQLFPDHGELDALLGNTGDDRKYSFPNLQGYIWGEYDQLDESKRRAKNLPFNIDNRGTDEQKALYDGLEHRVKRIREEYVRQFVETRADMKAIWQVILTNSDVSSKTRGTHLGEDSFLNLDSWVNEKTLFEGFIGEGVTKIASDLGDVINRSFTTGNRYQDIYKRGPNGKVILNMHKRREIDAFKRLNLSPGIIKGQDGFWRGEYYSEADFVSNYVTAAQKYGIYLSEDEIKNAQDDMWDSTAYGVGHLIPVIALQSTLLFPVARMGTMNVVSNLSKLFSRVKKGVGLSTPLKSIYSSKDLARLKSVPVEKGGLKGSGITTLEEMTLNTQLSQALRYSALRQYMYSKGPVGKMAWNLGEAGTITGTAFYLTPGEDYTFASGAGLGIGATGFGMMFPSTSAGNYLYRRYLDPKKVNAEGFVPKTVGYLDKTVLGLSLYGGGIASGSVGMYAAELADAWANQGLDFMSAAQMVVGTTEDEVVQKFCSTLLFASAFHLPQARAFVKQGKNEIAEKILKGDYPIEVKEYANKCLKAIEQYQGTMGYTDVFGYQSTRELINNDKYGSFWIIPKERGVNHGSRGEIESDISHRLDKNNLDSYSLVSARRKELSEAENKSRTEELITDLEARKQRGTISEYERVNVIDENGNVTEVFMVYGMDGAAAYQVSKTYQQDRYITNEGIYYLTGENKGFMRRTTGEYNMSDGFGSDYIQIGVKLKGEFEKGVDVNYAGPQEFVKIRPKYENKLVQAEYGQNVPEPNNIQLWDFVYNKKTREFVYTVKAKEGDIPAIELVLKRNVEGQFILEGRNIDMLGIEALNGVKIIQEGDINLYNLGVGKKDKAVQIIKDFMRQRLEGKSMQNAYIPTSFDYNSIETNKNQIKEHNESGNSFFSDLYGSIKGQTYYVLNNVFPERSIIY